MLSLKGLRALDTLVFSGLALFDRKSAELNESGRALLVEQRLNSKELFKDAIYVESVGHSDS